MAIYKLVWDDFCSWYLEMIKPAYQHPIDNATLEATITVFDKLMRVMHPFMPFLSEEIWHLLKDRAEGESIMVCDMPVAGDYSEELLQQFDHAAEAIQAIRSVRKEKNIPFKEQIDLFIKKNNEAADLTFDPIISKLCNLNKLEYVIEKVEDALSIILHATEFYIPLTESVDVDAEIAKLEEELKYTRGFLTSVEKKLSNDRFVNNAPEKVVAMERRKQEDAQNKIAVIEQQLASLKK